MPTVDFTPDNYRIIIGEPVENKVYYTRAYLENMLDYYFGDMGEVEAAKQLLLGVDVPDILLIRVQMAVVVLSEGNLHTLKNEVTYVASDYRDILAKFP